MFRRWWRKLHRFYWQVRRGDWSVGRCRHCQAFRLLYWTNSMTMYVDESQNFNGYLCCPCKVEYCEYWQERWDDYNSGRM